MRKVRRPERTYVSAPEPYAGCGEVDGNAREGGSLAR